MSFGVQAQGDDLAEFPSSSSGGVALSHVGINPFMYLNGRYLIPRLHTPMRLLTLSVEMEIPA